MNYPFENDTSAVIKKDVYKRQCAYFLYCTGEADVWSGYGRELQ